MGKWLQALVVCALMAAPARAQDPPPQPRITEIAVTGATIFTPDDVQWLLHLRRGEPLPADPEEIGKRLERLYEREGFTAARVKASLDGGRLTLAVDEGTFSAIDIQGASPRLRQQLEESLEGAGVRPGDPFNEPAARRAIRRVLAPSAGGLTLQTLDVVDRDGGRRLRVDVHRARGDFSISTGSGGREDLFSPVDGLSFPLAFNAVAYDSGGFNYTVFSGFASWKFGRNDAGYSLGMERPLLSNTRLFLGAEIHDVTASDDMWRLLDVEQTVAAAGWKNTFRDYYRRRGTQVHVGTRPNRHHELVASWRWDRHEPLANDSDFSLFRQDREYRANPLVADAELEALVLAYSYDTRSLDEEPVGERFTRHLVSDLFRAGSRGGLGFRLDWTSEIAGHAMGGDYDFTRHILNTRGGVRLGQRQTVAMRAMGGWSDGTLPIERQFALGGVGSVRAHAFKEAVGTSLALFNAEYAFLFAGRWEPGPRSLRMLLFYDAGRIGGPLQGTDTWMQAVGVGLQAGGIRVEWGFRPDDIPKSGQVLVRLGRTF